MAEQTYNFDGIAAAPPPPAPPGNPGSLRALTNDYALPSVHAFSPKVEKAINSPLIHPTGINAVDSLTSPLNLALTATLGARSAAKALSVASEAVSAGVDKAIVAKTLKFLTPTKFREGLDLLTMLAEKAVGAKAEAAPPAPAAPVAPIGSAPAAPAPPIEVPPPPAASAPPPAAPPASAAPVPSPEAPPPGNGLPDQRALNEAVRRAAYQARMKTAPPVVEAPAAPAANVKLSAVETKAFLDLMKRGMSGPDAMKNVLLQRSLVEQLGTPTPTGADTRFPKGMRGKPYQP